MGKKKTTPAAPKAPPAAADTGVVHGSNDDAAKGVVHGSNDSAADGVK